MNFCKNRLAAVVAFLFITGSCAAQKQSFSILKTFRIRSGGGWDYLAVNPANSGLYVSHGTQVNVLDKTTGDSLGVFLNTTGVHGIAFAPESGQGFISNGKLDNIFVFNLAANKILDSIPTGSHPDAMCYDPFSKKLFVGNGHSNNVTVIDPATDKAIATIALTSNPEASVTDEHGLVYINLEAKNEIAVIDTKTLSVIKTYSVAPGDGPTGLAIDNKAHRLFAGCGNKKMIVLDAVTGKQISVLTIGDHCDGVAFDPGTGNAFASCGDGTLSVVHEDRKGAYAVTETISTKRGARTIAVDTKTHLVYLPAAEFEPQTPGSKERPKMIPGTFQVLVIGKK